MFTQCIFTQISLLITSLYSTNFWVIFHASSLFRFDLLELIIATLPQTPEFIADGAHLLGIFSAIILSEWLHQEYALQSNSMNPTIRNIVHGRTNARLNQAQSAAYLYYSSSTRSIIARGLFLARVTKLHDEISTAYNRMPRLTLSTTRPPRCHHSFICVSNMQLNSIRLGSNPFAGQYRNYGHISTELHDKNSPWSTISQSISIHMPIGNFRPGGEQVRKRRLKRCERTWHDIETVQSHFSIHSLSSVIIHWAGLNDVSCSVRFKKEPKHIQKHTAY